jgi:hypothetical protein
VDAKVDSVGMVAGVLSKHCPVVLTWLNMKYLIIDNFKLFLKFIKLFTSWILKEEI